MDGVELVKALQQLEKFKNDKGFIEIAIRGKNRKFKAFQKIALGQMGQGKEQQMMQDMFAAINKGNKLNMNNAKALANIKNLNQINMVLNGLNLCATAAGFAIIYMKLDKMSKQINEVLDTVKKGQDINAHYEFKKILSTHSDMLDHRKTQRYYSEEQMRELVDGEYNVLCMLKEVFEEGVSVNNENLVYSIISLATMLSVSLRYFDEMYYYNTKDVIKGDDIWHSTHDSWMKVYDDLTSKQFNDKLQDYALFDLGLTTQECDVLCVSVNDTVKDAKKEIEDNQYLLTKFGERDIMNAFKESNNDQAKGLINTALNDSGLKENKKVNESFDKAMKQVGLAY